MKESVFHDIVQKDVMVQDSILSALNISGKSYSFIHEDQYPNGLIADFTIKKDNVVKAILELKASDIEVNDYVRGIGQVMQYQHFADSNLTTKGYIYDNTVAVYLLPSTITTHKRFNIGLFKYPDKSVLMELNEVNHNIRLISDTELSKLAKESEASNLMSVSQYYLRDIRLFELYLCLKYCQIRKLYGDKRVDRKEAEKNFLSNLGTPNNKNWRNAFISLSSLGLIDSNNFPTIVGSKYATGEYCDFCYEMYNSYIKIYIDLIMDALYKIKKAIASDSFQASYNDIKNIIEGEHGGKQVMFLTESGNRYLSSWLNILRDDFNCINFASRKDTRTILYNIEELNQHKIIEKIKNNTLANNYINKMNILLNP